jgi:hypothetical protein
MNFQSLNLNQKEIEKEFLFPSELGSVLLSFSCYSFTLLI